MNIKLQVPAVKGSKPRITVMGVGGAGGNAIDNMIAAGLDGVEFIVANTDAQALSLTSAPRTLQLGANLTEGLGAGSKPDIGEAAAEETVEEIRSEIAGSHMIFIAAGMGGGTGTGAAAVIAREAKKLGILTVAIVTKPFLFEGTRRMRTAEAGVVALRQHVDTLIVIPNQNLFRIADENTTFSEAFKLADGVLHSGICCIVDLIVKDGLINLDFADVATIMHGMGDAVMGTGESEGEGRAVRAAEQAIANPLLDDVTLEGALGLLVSIAGGKGLTLHEVEQAANRVREEVDPEANIIVGSTIDETLKDTIRVSIVASGMPWGNAAQPVGWDSAQRAVTAHSSPLISDFVMDPPPLVATSPPAGNSSLRAGGQAGSADSDDISAALSEAIREAEAETAKAAGKNRPVDWESSNGVRVRSHDGEASGDETDRMDAAFPFAVDSDARGEATHFEPRMTETVRRPATRMPSVEDFPVVGQREYHAKREVAMSGSSEHYEHQDGRAKQKSGKKRSLISRITGFRLGSNDSSKKMPSRSNRSKKESPKQTGEGPKSQLRPQWSSAAGDADIERDEDIDLPNLFGKRSQQS